MTSGQEIFLSIFKGKDAFNQFAGKDGLLAASLSEAAVHAYDAVGKDWRKRLVSKREFRRKNSARDAEEKAKTADRDKPWPCCPANLEGLASMHVHSKAGDRSRKHPK